MKRKAVRRGAPLRILLSEERDLIPGADPHQLYSFKDCVFGRTAADQVVVRLRDGRHFIVKNRFGSRGFIESRRTG